MKKIIGFAVTLFTVATLFAAARPSLDGRALVADAGTMPKGLFARTIGYLPGDSVAVTNPATGSTVDVLILGAIDPSEGVAILLSPEAADQLNITKDSNVQVKITKRAGSLDETAAGAAVLSESDEPYDDEYDESETLASAPVAATEEAEADAEVEAETVAVSTEPTEFAAVAETVEPLESSAPLTEATADDLFADSAYDTTVPAESEPYATAYADDDLFADDAYSDAYYYDDGDLFTETADTSDALADTEAPVPEEPAGDLFSDTLWDDLALEGTPAPAADDTDRIVFIEAPGEPADDVALADTATADEPSAELFADSEPVTAADEPVEYVEDIAPAFEDVAASERVTFDDVGTITEPVAEAAAPDAADEVADEEAYDEESYIVASYSEDETEITPAQEESAVATVPETPVASVAASSDTETYDTYQPIVLVPAGENPPVNDDESLDVAQPSFAVASAEAAPEPAPSPVAEVAAETVTKAKTVDDYLVPSLKDLQSGSYYVQIASLGSVENIDALLAQYAEKYPMVVVPLSSGKAYQVMVGPLSRDEYATVHERFKAYGFKDAFLRKIR